MASFFTAGMAFAQSSGNFTASVDNTVCSINSMSTGGGTGGNFIITGSSGASLSTTIKLPNSSPALLVTPSLATGLYTNTSATGTTSVNETAAVVVTVSDTFGTAPPVVLTPNKTCVDTSMAQTGCSAPSPTCKCGLVYDERFQLLNTMLSGSQFVQLVRSTLSAHSFNFVEGNVPGGIHTITMAWYFGCDDGTGHLTTSACKNSALFTPNSAAACAGPGSLTVQQVQNFEYDSQVQTSGTP
jgi:hypothetical protein